VYLIGIILTFIVALTTIKLFMNYIERISLKIFVIYRVFLGLVILLFVYFN
jgi:undecaprenyl-diphosphatase